MTECKQGKCVVGLYREDGNYCENPISEDYLKIIDNLEDVIRSNFCPECGHKIEWDRLEKELND